MIKKKKSNVYKNVWSSIFYNIEKLNGLMFNNWGTIKKIRIY